MWSFDGHSDNVIEVEADSEGNVYSSSDDETLKKYLNNRNKIHL